MYSYVIPQNYCVQTLIVFKAYLLCQHYPLAFKIMSIPGEMHSIMGQAYNSVLTATYLAT